MASTKEIKNRIKSVQDTQKITNAMYLISSTKMRKAKAALDNTRPYFNRVRAEIKRIFRDAPMVSSRYFYPENPEEKLNGTYAYLVITADKGLAGAYNQNVLKEARRMMEEHGNCRLYVVGEYGRQYFMNHRIPIEQSFLYTAQNPTIERAREICDVILEPFDRGEIDKIFVVYTDMKNSVTEEVASTRILPFHREHFVDSDEKPVKNEFEFVPDVTTVLENVTKSYVSGFIYAALVDSFCSEQNARMTAMNSANQNAEEILGELKIQYNRVRQAAITQEITEVSAGAKAQKRKRKMKLEMQKQS
jgi:F-type H+-transporting ATPase subunit gamma